MSGGASLLALLAGRVVVMPQHHEPRPSPGRVHSNICWSPLDADRRVWTAADDEVDGLRLACPVVG